MLRDILSKLSDPSASYRGTPFWAWNAKLDPEEIRTQIRAFHKMGLGGFFMHSRTGLGTPYLGKEWFECVRAAVDEAKKLGMQPWMYDEDRWPSGSAGGFVTKSQRYRQRWIEVETVSAAALPKAVRRRRTLAWFAVRVAGAEDGLSERALMKLAARDKDGRLPPFLSCRRLSDPLAETLRGGEVLMRFFEQIAGNNTWYNGQSYVDVLNPAAIRKFVSVTHEAYLRELGDDFGKVVPGCFTDEPNFHSRAWTAALPRTFAQQHGYDVLDVLPELFTEVGGEKFSRARHDYVETLTTLFVKAFSKTIGQWCGKHGLQFTGHALAEDTLSSQTCYGGSAMRFYEFQQAPGIDQLTERWAIFQTAKQCSSVAHQLGRAYRLVEAYGCTGWDFPLEGHKALGDWLVALGINHRCQHLAWYSMDAEAKRDYPASISRQSPWYGKYKAEEDYFARIGETLGAGTEVTPLLVVHAEESMWGHWYPKVSGGKVQELDDSFAALTGRLLGAHLDFDYGSEDHLARWGKAAGRHLRVAKAKYDGVLLPALETVRGSTLGLLADFAAKGGRVFYLGEPPARVDAVPSDRAAKAYEAFMHVTLENLPRSLRDMRRVSIAEDSAECEGVLYQERDCGDGLAVFACNTSWPMPKNAAEYFTAPMVRDRVLAYPKAVLRVKAPKTAAKTGKENKVYELDLMTGRFRAADFEYTKGYFVIPAPFGRLQSRMFLVTSEKIPVSAAWSVPEDAPAAWSVPIPETGLKYALDDENVLVLDAARWSADGGELHDTTRALDIDRALRAELGAESRKGHMTQPWCSAEKTPERSLALRLEYAFSCEGAAGTEVSLALEHPELYDISLNGTAVPNEYRDALAAGKPVPPLDSTGSWWVDPCLRRLRIPAGALREGANTLVLSGRFDETQRGLEAMFLLGGFGVSPDGATIRPLPAALDLGDVCAQGLTNYSGNLFYRFKASVPPKGAVRVSADPWRGAAVGFRVNGGEEKFRPFPPFEAVFEDGLRRDGSDEFEIVVYGHRRNAFGPFYVRGGVKWPSWTGPGEMGDTTETVRALVPFGLGAGK